MATTFTNSGVDVFVAVSIKHGLKMWRDHKMIPNRAFTATKMMATAARITGKTYKRGEYGKAIRDLESWIDINGTRATEKGDVR